MKNVLLIVMLLFSGAFTNAQSSYTNKAVKILPQSKLTITGDTNINSFECIFNTSLLQKENRFQYISDTPKHLRFRNAVLSLKANGFDCGSRAINNDFHKLIRSDKYPEILIELVEIRLQNQRAANAVVNITIAGITKEHTFPVEFSEGEIAHITGILMLDIKDFKLEPPKKLFGMIVVKDDIEINFDLVVKM